ncbi:hypothetical protein RND71_011848 [Anisodus tanguticus]|uniref:Major facilitator superfamily (MFS) profile domain-containing protein n=1 Tax=Anisodus tanguticus TaxID=243964 RepID=A0AAE1SE62_9SOLA|nr:hypothetical protein RND71_011848 [Anisodus tanguticus]
MQTLMIASIPNNIGWLAVSFATDVSFLYMGRLLEGFGVGIISYVVPVYIAEISPKNMRGVLGSINQVIVTGISPSLVDKAGRRLLLIVSSSVMTASSFLVAMAFFLKGCFRFWEAVKHRNRGRFWAEKRGGSEAQKNRHVGCSDMQRKEKRAQVLVMAFGVGLGSIPWIIISEV